MKLGKAFSDSVIIEQKAMTHMGIPKVRVWWLGAGRALLFASVLFIALFVLVWRLFDLTVIRGHTFRALADGNRTREIIRHAPRGKIFDRTGKLLADNTPTDQGYAFTRTYPAKEATSHIVGYIGEITPEELSDQYYQLRSYRAGDRIGRMGAEAVFEERLRGRDGKELVEITATGEITRTLGRVEEIAGEDVTLAIDRSLSEAASRAFEKEAKGAVVLSRPATGEILALFTSPSFDANIFSQMLPKSAYDALFENPDLPMFNRAIGGVYPPGSTFKLVTAIAALEEAAVTEKTLIDDVGVLQIGLFRFPNWYFTQYGKTEGLVDIVKALQRSNDIYFYKAGETVGITKLATWAKRVGIGAPLGIEIPGEAAGLMPDPTWKARRFDTPADREAGNDQWYLGDTYHVAIGQGYLLTTPLQVNSWTNVIANGGRLCKPTIEKKNQACITLGIKKETIERIAEGMKRACLPGGTGWPLFNFQVPVACKTGTAEFGDPDDKTHAWFTAFAPIEDPEISVTVLVEGAGEGSDKAAPIAKDILTEWFSR